MGWNHRVLAHKDGDEGIFLQIHEVYYNRDDEPNGYTKNGVTVGGDDIKSIMWVINKMTECTNKPILWAGERFPEEYVEETT